MDEKSTGAVGILAVAVCIGVLIAAKMFFPSLFTVLLWIIGIIIALILVLIGAVFYFAFRKPKPGEEETAKAKANRIISDGRNKVMSIRRNVMSIKNAAVKNSGIKVCSGADKILGVLRQKPELMQKNRQFFTYYLPTFGSIIEKYERIEKNEMASEDMVQKVLEHLDDMKIAFEKQYKSLFSGDMLDLTVEIEAMTIACRRDGLLSEEDFEKDKENSIDLEF